MAIPCRQLSTIQADPGNGETECRVSSPHLLKVVNRELGSASRVGVAHLDIFALDDTLVGLGFHEPRHEALGGGGEATQEANDEKATVE